jgi:hypothetical protein
MGLHINKWRAWRCVANACNQGRQPCPCPKACQQPVDEMLSGYRRAMVSALVVVLCVLVALWVAA